MTLLELPGSTGKKNKKTKTKKQKKKQKVMEHGYQFMRSLPLSAMRGGRGERKTEEAKPPDRKVGSRPSCTSPPSLVRKKGGVHGIDNQLNVSRPETKGAPFVEANPSPSTANPQSPTPNTGSLVT